MITPRPLPDRWTALHMSAVAGEETRAAIRALSNAAAVEERLGKTPDEGETGAAAMWWMLVRTLCRETGNDYDAAVRSARQFADTAA